MAGPSDAQALLLTLSADTSKALKSLDQLNVKLAGIQPQAQKAAKSIEDAFSQTKLGKASFALGDEIGGKLKELTSAAPAAGGALLALGPAGIAAAAGIGAVALALPKVRQALDFVDEIGDASAKLHVGAEALQAYRFASVEAGGEARNFDEAIEGLTSKVGAFTSGLAKAGVVKAFAAVGLSKEQIESFHSVEELLPAIADRLAAVGSQAERAALADKLGVRPLLPLLEQGSAKLAEFTGKARDMGVVINGSVIREMGDLQRQVEISSQTIDTNLKVAFLNLAPLLVRIADLAANAAKAIALIPTAAAGLNYGKGGSQGATDQPGRDVLGHGFQQVLGVFGGRAVSRAVERGPAVQLRRKVQDSLNNPAAGARAAQEFRDAVAAENRSLKSNLPPVDATPKGSKGVKGPSAESLARKAEEQRKSTADTLADAAKRVEDAYGEELRAILGVTTDISARAELESRQVDAATEAAAAADRKKLADVRSQEALGRVAAGTVAEVAGQQAIAAAVREKAADLQKQAIDRRRDDELLEQTRRDQERINAAYDQVLQVAAGQARTVGERQALQLQLLASEKRQADRALSDERSKALRGAELGGEGTINSRFNALQKSSDAAFTARGGEIIQNNLGPLQQWAKEAPKTAQEIGEAFERYAVKALDDLNSGLADAIAKGASIGDVLKTAFQQAESALISYLLKQAEIGLLGDGKGVMGLLSGLFSALPKHAAGTDFARGGLSLVGERGPELVNLPTGSGVISNANLSALANMSDVRASGPQISIAYAPTYSVSGSGPELDRLRGEMAADRASFAGRAAAAVQDGLRRGAIRTTRG